MSISSAFIARPIATSLLMAGILLIGAAAYPLLPVAPLPQVDFPTILVTTHQGPEGRGVALQALSDKLVIVGAHVTPTALLDGGGGRVVPETVVQRSVAEETRTGKLPQFVSFVFRAWSLAALPAIPARKTPPVAGCSAAPAGGRCRWFPGHSRRG